MPLPAYLLGKSRGSKPVSKTSTLICNLKSVITLPSDICCCMSVKSAKLQKTLKTLSGSGVLTTKKWSLVNSMSHERFSLYLLNQEQEENVHVDTRLTIIALLENISRCHKLVFVFVWELITTPFVWAKKGTICMGYEWHQGGLMLLNLD